MPSAIIPSAYQNFKKWRLFSEFYQHQQFPIFKMSQVLILFHKYPSQRMFSFALLYPFTAVQLFSKLQFSNWQGLRIPQEPRLAKTA